MEKFGMKAISTPSSHNIFFSQPYTFTNNTIQKNVPESKNQAKISSEDLNTQDVLNSGYCCLRYSYFACFLIVFYLTMIPTIIYSLFNIQSIPLHQSIPGLFVYVYSFTAFATFLDSCLKISWSLFGNVFSDQFIVSRFLPRILN